MLSLDWWWVLSLLPLPLLVRNRLSSASSQELALVVPLLQRSPFSASNDSRQSSRWSGVFLWLFWIGLIFAASRPVWLGEAVARSVSGRDLMLAVDISGSMSEADMMIDSRPANRLEVLKLVVGKFIERRQGDRLGLILFGTNAYSYVPLTYDLDTLKKLLLDVSTGLAGRHTAIGDAIGIAIKSMHQQPAAHKVLVLVTDGSNTAGFENPVLAAAAAAAQGMTIYTIGIGSDIETLSRIYGLQSIPAGVALNEKVLSRIATTTGGQYFRATNTARLELIYQALDQLEPLEYVYQSQRPRSELFMWPLAAAQLILLLQMGLTIRRSRSVSLR